MTLNTWQDLIQPDTQWVIGADECGTGAYAGDVFVCAARVPVDWKAPPGLADSKKVKTVAKRELLFDLLRPVTRSVQRASPKELDAQGLTSTLRTLFKKAVLDLLVPHSIVILDGKIILEDLEYTPLIHADALVPAVSAASVIGKVLRDRHMTEMAKLHPGYNFGKHFGYGSEEHETALKSKGPSPIHRMSYGPMRASLEELLQMESVGMVLE